jgi:predicted flap endonuclease-1-like 5' DNA nuclease
MEYGDSQTVLTMLKAMAIGLAAGYVIWGWRRSGSTGATGGAGPAAGTPKPPAANAETPKPAPTVTVAATPAAAKPEAAKPEAPKVAAARPEAAKPAPAQVAAPPAPPPANLLAERPGRIDDLKQIKGIGPKMEKVLNSRGVWQYDQLAAFTAEDLAWLDAAVESFPGRAERDHWVDQAKALIAARDAGG